ncbi:hypothetical protein [Pseudomonas sp. LB3P25]
MLINIKKSSALSVGNMKCQISLPFRPSFYTEDVSRAVWHDLDKQFVAGLADYGNGNQDLLTIWFPSGLVQGKQSVLPGTGLIRLKEAEYPEFYNFSGEVSITLSDSDRLVGTFNLKGVNFTVNGEFDTTGLDIGRNYERSDG